MAFNWQCSYGCGYLCCLCPFLPHFLLPLSFLRICLDTAPRTASFFSDVLLRLGLLVEGEGVQSMSVFCNNHDCEAYWPRLRDHLKAPETLTIVWSKLAFATLSLQYSTFSQYSHFLTFWNFGFHELESGIKANKGLKYFRLGVMNLCNMRFTL